MRLRPLTEAECYSRLYGGHGTDKVSVVRPDEEDDYQEVDGERLRELFERRLQRRRSEAEAA
ncbi:MAG TPA: hypothetical protein VG652_08755 [Gaiellaceae bacterium]|nr:hypothetical protein [Gaiellaceae bacterium]